MTLKDRPARPRVARTAPSYPRTLLVAATLAVSGCAIYDPLSETPDPAGDIAFPWDSGPTPADARVDDAADASDTLGDADPAGFSIPPYDSAPLPDAAVDADADPDAAADVAVDPDAAPDPDADGGD